MTFKVLRCAVVTAALLVAARPVLSAATPKLIVILVGDQVRADYLERYHGDLAPDGLRRFREGGAYFTHAAMDHALTKTSPGHTLLGSGLYPAQSGIIGNEWYDRSSGKIVSAAELVPGGRRTQLRWFVGTSFAQRLHQMHPHSRIVSLSLKDRGALLLTGPDQDDAYWWDSTKQAFVSYSVSAPAWLGDFNQTIPSFALGHPRWTPLSDPSPPMATAFAAIAQLTAGHLRDDSGMGLQFPHATRSLRALISSPYSDELVEQLSEVATQEWGLGKNPTGDPDVLTVSFSAVDLVGHAFGPDSLEVRDAFLRLDQDVAKLMKNLQARIGPDIVWVFSSDHGVTAFPEVSKAKGLDAGRVRFDKTSLPHGERIEAVSTPYIYLDPAVLKQQNITLDQAIAELKTGLLKIAGVLAAYSQSDVKNGNAPESVLRSFYLPKKGEPERGGDLYVVLKPYYIFSDDAYGTTHGQPTADDQQVPLGFYGSDIHPHVFDQPISPAVVAPTLLQQLHIPAPDLAAPAPVFE